MAVENRSLSEFPRALQVAEQALVMISNPDGLGGYDTNGAVLTEVGKALLNVQYTQQLGNVSVFDAIKNTRVLSGTATPASNIGADGQLYVKYETVSNIDNVVGMYFKKDGAWLEISLGGGGGASVTLGTTVPSDASGDNGDLYVQYDSLTYAVVEYFVKVNDSWRIAPYSRVVSLTQAQYDLITPDPTTLYIITDAQSSYQTKSDNSLDTDDKTVVGAINEVNTALSGLNSDSYFKNDSDTINPSVSKNVLEKALTKGIYDVSFTITFQTTDGDKSLFTVIREHASPNTALLSQSIKSLSGDFSSMVCSGIIKLETDMTIDFRVGNKLSNNTIVNYRISIIKLI